MATLLLLLELSFQIEIPFEKEREAREGKRPGRVICVPPLLSWIAPCVSRD